MHPSQQQIRGLHQARAHTWCRRSLSLAIYLIQCLFTRPGVSDFQNWSRTHCADGAVRNFHTKSSAPYEFQSHFRVRCEGVMTLIKDFTKKIHNSFRRQGQTCCNSTIIRISHVAHTQCECAAQLSRAAQLISNAPFTAREIFHMKKRHILQQFN